MNNLAHLIIAFTVGVALGVIYFLGLYYTIRKSLYSKKSALWFTLSFIVDSITSSPSNISGDSHTACFIISAYPSLINLCSNVFKKHVSIVWN